MRAYVITSGLLFMILVVAHVARILSEGLRVATEADFAASTMLAIGMSAWALWLVRRCPADVSSNRT
ncbi:MAG: hypothetical protein ACREQZ_02480 [Woeseiaceae bacterium]